MLDKQQLIALEAYLDDELSPAQTQDFTALLATDLELQAALDERLAARREFLLALGEDIPLDDPLQVVKTAEATQPTLTGVRRFPYSRTGIALAASICLVILVPWMLRNDNGAEGPRSILTTSGQVAVVRYGEIPGETMTLETGAIELPAGLSR